MKTMCCGAFSRPQKFGRIIHPHFSPIATNKRGKHTLAIVYVMTFTKAYILHNLIRSATVSFLHSLILVFFLFACRLLARFFNLHIDIKHLYNYRVFLTMSTHEYETPKNTTNNNNRRFSSNKKIPAPSPPTEGNVEFVKSKNYTHYKHTRHITEDEKIYETITTSSGPKTVNKSSTTYRTTEVNTTPPKEKDRQKRYFDNDVRLVNTEDKCDRATPDHKVHSMNRKG